MICDVALFVGGKGWGGFMRQGKEMFRTVIILYNYIGTVQTF